MAMGAISQSIVTREDEEVVGLCDKLKKIAITEDDSDDDSGWDEFIQQFQDPLANPLNHEHKVYTTGIARLDDHLGGLTSGTVNEFMGFTASGKTYLTHSILLSILSQRDFKALIITNSPVQSVYASLRSILERKNCGSDAIAFTMKRIKVQFFGDINELSRILRYLIGPGTYLMHSHKVLLLDGFSSEFLKHYMKRSKRFLRKVYTNLQIIRRLTNNHDVLVLITNLTVSRNSQSVRNHSKATVVQYSQVTSLDWPLFMDNRYLLHKTESLNPNYADFLVHVKVIKSLYQNGEHGPYCLIKLTDEGFK